MSEKLKNARLARAEDLSQATRDKYNLPSTGMVVIMSKEVDDDKTR